MIIYNETAADGKEFTCTVVTDVRLWDGVISVVIYEPLLMIIEYVPLGDLLGYLRVSRGLKDTYFKDPDIKPQTNLTSLQLMKFARQIADGMSCLSSKSVGFY